MGRSRKTLTPEQVKQVESLAAVMTEEQIADFFGFSERTLRNRMTEDPKIVAAYKKGKAKAIGMAGENLLKLVRKGNLGALCFFLKTQAGWRETTRQEVTGKDGAPLEVDVTTARNAIASRIAGIAARLGTGSDPEPPPAG